MAVNTLNLEEKVAKMSRDEKLEELRLARLDMANLLNSDNVMLTNLAALRLSVITSETELWS